MPEENKAWEQEALQVSEHWPSEEEVQAFHFPYSTSVEQLIGFNLRRLKVKELYLIFLFLEL